MPCLPIAFTCRIGDDPPGPNTHTPICFCRIYNQPWQLNNYSTGMEALGSGEEFTWLSFLYETEMFHWIDINCKSPKGEEVLFYWKHIGWEWSLVGLVRINKSSLNKYLASPSNILIFWMFFKRCIHSTHLSLPESCSVHVYQTILINRWSSLGSLDFV